MFRITLAGAASALVLSLATSASAADPAVPERQSQTVGTQKVLVARTHIKDKATPGDRIPQNIVDDVYEAIRASSDRFEEFSYFRTNFDVEVFPYYIEGTTKADSAHWEDILAVDPSLSRYDYDRILIDNHRGGAGLANAPGQMLWTAALGGALDHEFAHTYGVIHPDGVQLPKNLAPYTKIRWGWMEENAGGRGDYIEIDSSQTVRLYEYKESGELPSDGYRAAAIAGTEISLAMLFKTGLPGEQFSGLSVYDVDDMVDTTPNSAGTVSKDFKDGHIAVGRTWTQGPATIEVLAFDGSDPSARYVDVRVDLPEGYLEDAVIQRAEIVGLDKITYAEPGETLDFEVITSDSGLYYYLCAAYRGVGLEAWNQIDCDPSYAGNATISWTPLDRYDAYEVAAAAWVRDNSSPVYRTDYIKQATVYIGAEPAPEPQPDPDPVPSGSGDLAVAGIVNASSTAAGQSRTHSLSAAPGNAVVVVGPPTSNGPDPFISRVKQVTSSGFKLQAEEWTYQDQSHENEKVGFAMVAAGAHTLSDGTRMVAGEADNAVGGNWTRVEFGSSFSAPPVVAVQVASARSTNPVVARVRNVNSSGFDVRLQHEESLKSEPVTHEDIAFIAMEPGSATHNGARIHAGNVYGVKHHVVSETFPSSFAGTPAVLATQQTQAGGDTATVRITDSDRYGVSLFVQEEKSRDTEISHAGETIGIIAFETGSFED